MEGYKILNILNKYTELYNKKIIIKFKNVDEQIDFYFNQKNLSHLMGLQYANNPSLKANEFAKKILKNNLKDSDIYNEISTNNYKKIDVVEKRINNIEYMLENLEKCVFTLSNNSDKSQINSRNFLLQNKDGKVLELGVAKTSTDEYYLETFLVRNNDKNVDYSLRLNIDSIWTLENNKEIPFSFEKEKNFVLNYFYKKNKDFNYHEVIKSIDKIEKILNPEKEDLWEKKLEKEKDIGLER